MHKLLKSLDDRLSFETVSAHCDIPCKIYDPISAQIAALSLVRMIDLLLEIAEKEELTVADYSQIARLTAEKEVSGAKVKDEVAIIWGDYFKKPQFEQVEGVHDLAHSIMMQGSKAKQNVDRDEAVELVNLVNQFAEAFWKTKGVETYKAVSPYPPELEVVYPKLG